MWSARTMPESGTNAPVATKTQRRRRQYHLHHKETTDTDMADASDDAR